MSSIVNFHYKSKKTSVLNGKSATANLDKNENGAKYTIYAITYLNLSK